MVIIQGEKKIVAMGSWPPDLWVSKAFTQSFYKEPMLLLLLLFSSTCYEESPYTFSSFPAPSSTPYVPLLLYSLSPPYIPRFSSSPYHSYILSSSSSIYFLFLLFSRVFCHFTFNLFPILLFISCNFVHTFCPFAFTFFISSLCTSFFLFSLSFLQSVFAFFYTFSLFVILPCLLPLHRQYLLHLAILLLPCPCAGSLPNG